jgi:ATPase subunit of ABC transporter with duplicated ATPase domains
MADFSLKAMSKNTLEAIKKDSEGNVITEEETKEKEDRLELFIPPGPRLGAVVIEAEHISKAYGDKLLIEDFSFNLPQAGIVGIIGPNGAGKTTLFRMIMDQVKPDTGSFNVGETVKVAYVDQSHDSLIPDKTVYEIIGNDAENIMIGNKSVNARSYISKFNFNGADQQKKLSVLSGGERNRVHLAMTLKMGANVLLLDEPTNDIDINTLRALEEALENFAGCAVIISHDRWFLDRVCTHIIAFEGDSQVVYFEGGYTDYEEAKRKRVGNAEPKKFRYKKLTV